MSSSFASRRNRDDILFNFLFDFRGKFDALIIAVILASGSVNMMAVPILNGVPFIVLDSSGWQI